MGLLDKLLEGSKEHSDNMPTPVTRGRSPEKERVLAAYKASKSKRRGHGAIGAYRGGSWESADVQSLAPQIWDEIVTFFCHRAQNGAESVEFTFKYSPGGITYNKRPASLSLYAYGTLSMTASSKLKAACSPDRWARDMANRARAAGFAVETSEKRDDRILTVELVSAAEREEVERELAEEEEVAAAARKAAYEEKQQVAKAAYEKALAGFENEPESVIEKRVSAFYWERAVRAVANNPGAPVDSLEKELGASGFAALSSMPYPATATQFERKSSYLFGSRFDPSCAHAVDRALWEFMCSIRNSRAYAGDLAGKLPGKWFDLVNSVAGLDATPTIDELRSMIADAGLDTFDDYAMLMGYAMGAEVPNRKDWDEHQESRFGAGGRQDLQLASSFVANAVTEHFARFPWVVAQEEAERARRQEIEAAQAALAGEPASAIEHKMSRFTWESLLRVVAFEANDEQRLDNMEKMLPPSALAQIVSCPFPATTTEYRAAINSYFGEASASTPTHTVDRTLRKLAERYSQTRQYAGKAASALPVEWVDVACEIADMASPPSDAELRSLIASAELDTPEGYAALAGYEDATKLWDRAAWNRRVRVHLQSRSNDKVMAAARHIAQVAGESFVEFPKEQAETAAKAARKTEMAKRTEASGSHSGAQREAEQREPRRRRGDIDPVRESLMERARQRAAEREAGTLVEDDDMWEPRPHRDNSEYYERLEANKAERKAKSERRRERLGRLTGALLAGASAGSTSRGGDYEEDREDEFGEDFEQELEIHENGDDREDENTLLPLISTLTRRRHATQSKTANVYLTGIRGTETWHAGEQKMEEFIRALAEHGPFAVIIDEPGVNYEVACIDSPYHIFQGVWEGPALSENVAIRTLRGVDQNGLHLEYNTAITIGLMINFRFTHEEINVFIQGNERDYEQCSWYMVNSYIRSTGYNKWLCNQGEFWPFK